MLRVGGARVGVRISALKVVDVAAPHGSLAVTVIVALPAARGSTRTSAPLTCTGAAAVLLDDAVKVRTISSGSSKASSTDTTSTVPPTGRVTSSMEPSTTGNWLGSVASAEGDHSPPPSSFFAATCTS